MKATLLSYVAIIAIVAVCNKLYAQDAAVRQDNINVRFCQQDAIKVDGILDEKDWKDLDFIKMPYVACGGKNSSKPSEADLSGKFKLLWSTNGIYLFEEIKDDVSNLWKEGAEYQVDNTELFFYTNPDKVRTEDGAYDEYAAQIRLQLTDADELKVSGRVNLEWSVPKTETIKFAFGTLPGGYTMEAMIPWDVLVGVKPEDLGQKVKEMGFEISVADADEAQRDICLQWNNDTENDLAWNNVNYLGKLTLMPKTGIFKVEDEKSFEVLINPVRNNRLEIKNMKNVKKLNISNIIGQTLIETDVANVKNLSLDVSKIQNGLLLINLTDFNGKINTYKVIK